MAYFGRWAFLLYVGRRRGQVSLSEGKAVGNKQRLRLCHVIDSRNSPPPTSKIRNFRVRAPFSTFFISMHHWSHYLCATHFILHSDHEFLKYINGQQKLSIRHAKWVEFLQSFNFSCKCNDGRRNVVVDALSRRYSLLVTLDVRLLGFETLKDHYQSDADFRDMFLKCASAPNGEFVIQDGFLFKGNHFCVPKPTIWDFLIHEAHGGGFGWSFLMGFEHYTIPMVHIQP
uniref:Reverse transcriptase RNase H-like domain-containing protein n=1 Tax=Lactuca sativa TaxID=4236 RepID=A0A9R1UEC0_LACSA|nr:hypothetical protein LSAT_V11C900458180 [Lactuca sativa]